MRSLWLTCVLASISVAARADSQPPDAGTPRQVILRPNIDHYYEPILFQRNATQPLPKGRQRLREVAQFMKDHPQLRLVEIVGHADDPGSEAKNQQISEERAKAVRHLLIDWGIEPQRLRARGVGTKEPMAPPNTVDGPPQNRRVELVIIKRDE